MDAAIENIEATFRKLRHWEQFQLLEHVAASIRNTNFIEARQLLEKMQYMLDQLDLDPKKEKARAARTLLHTSIRYLMQSHTDEWRDFPFFASIGIIEEFTRGY